MVSRNLLFLVVFSCSSSYRNHSPVFVTSYSGAFVILSARTLRPRVLVARGAAKNLHLTFTKNKILRLPPQDDSYVVFLTTARAGLLAIASPIAPANETRPHPLPGQPLSSAVQVLANCSLFSTSNSLACDRILAGGMSQMIFKDSIIGFTESTLRLIRKKGWEIYFNGNVRDHFPKGSQIWALSSGKSVLRIIGIQNT